MLCPIGMDQELLTCVRSDGPANVTHGCEIRPGLGSPGMDLLQRGVEMRRLGFMGVNRVLLCIRNESYPMSTCVCSEGCYEESCV